MHTPHQLTFDPAALIQTYSPDTAFAYGSGVFQQASYAVGERPMVDLIFGVENSREWHRQNLEHHAADYSALARTLGEGFVMRLQGMGAKIYYHPYIDYNGVTIKYGVISQEDMIEDLTDRADLYVAGRLHKPVMTLQSQSAVMDAVKKNYENAFYTALFFLPENFTEEQLYTAIAGLSYTGDSRMKYGETPDKVKNIVTKNMDGFASIYKQLISQKSNIITTLAGDTMQRAMDPRILAHIYQLLPSNLRTQTQFLTDFTDAQHITELLQRAIVTIVKRSSIEQSLKGILTAGTSKSVRYVREKLKKAKKK